MTLDEQGLPSTEDLIQYGRDETIRELVAAAEAEERAGGDGRAKRVLERLLISIGWK